MKILFLHGRQSVPGGVKPTFLAHQGHTVLNPKLPDEDFNEAVKIAQAEFDKHQPAVYCFLATGEDTDGKYALLEAIVRPVAVLLALPAASCGLHRQIVQARLGQPPDERPLLAVQKK
jgi:hypothetical protein